LLFTECEVISMEIIEELDKKGMNLQETILNLENQGYKEYYRLWLKYIWYKTKKKVILLEIKKICYSP